MDSEVQGVTMNWGQGYWVCNYRQSHAGFQRQISAGCDARDTCIIKNQQDFNQNQPTLVSGMLICAYYIAGCSMIGCRASISQLCEIMVLTHLFISGTELQTSLPKQLPDQNSPFQRPRIFNQSGGHLVLRR